MIFNVWLKKFKNYFSQVLDELLSERKNEKKLTKYKRLDPFLTIIDPKFVLRHCKVYLL